MTDADAELIEKVRDLTTPSEDGESWLERACRAADASAQLTKMKHEMARVILAQSAEIARLREALEQKGAADIYRDGFQCAINVVNSYECHAWWGPKARPDDGIKLALDGIKKALASARAALETKG